MSTMIEKVARRMWFEYVEMVGFPNGLMTWDEMISTGDKDRVVFEYRSLARAAVEAMMEPTEAMVSAGEGEDVVMANGTLVSCASALTHYEAMIQAALKEEAQ